MTELRPGVFLRPDPSNLWAVVQFMVWVLLFLALAMGRRWLERWLVARFQGRDPGEALGFAAWSVGLARPSMVQAMALLAGLLAGCAIPLLPQFQFAGRVITLSPLSASAGGLLYVLAMDWLSAGLLAYSTPRQLGLPSRTAIPGSVGAQLLAAVPSTLVVLSLVITSGALRSGQDGTLSLSVLVALQGNWSGLRWLAVLQPVACLLWVVSSMPSPSDPKLRVTLAWQVRALSRALLTTVLFAGGWQGPLVERYAGLGLLYTTVKVALFTFIWTWISASRPFLSAMSSSQSTWRRSTWLAGLNLLITAVVAALRIPLSGLGLP